MKKCLLFSAMLLSMLFIFSNVCAIDINEDTDSWGISEAALQKFGAYIDEECIVTENINGSAAVLGDTVSISSDIDGISFVLGNTVTLRGETEYLFLLGNYINLDGYIQKDSFILGATVKVSAGNKLGRDTVILAETVELSGNVERDITISAATVTINDATILGNIHVDADEIIISGDTQILGALSYYDSAKVDMANTVIVSDVNIMEAPIQEEETKEAVFMNKVTDTIYSWGTIIVVFLILVFVTPAFEKINKTLVTKLGVGNFIKTAGIGFLILIAVPFIFIILLCTIVGIPLAILLLILYILCIWLSSLLTGYAIVKSLFKTLFKKDIHNALAGIIGLVLISLLGFVPTLGGIIKFISLIFGMGTVIYLFKKVPEPQMESVILQDNNADNITRPEL